MTNKRRHIRTRLNAKVNLTHASLGTVTAVMRDLSDGGLYLNRQEREVMELVVDGKANKNIARALGISQRTVEIHRSRVMEKMNVRSVSMLVQLVIRAADRP